jgi:outer membrane protein
MNERLVRTSVVILLAAGAAAAAGQTPEGESLTLRRALELAAARAPDLSAARHAADAASSSARLASDAFHPQAFLTTTPGYASGLPVAVAGRVPAVAGVEVRQTLYDPAARTEALEAEARASEASGSRGETRSQTLVQTALAYTRLYADRALADAARRKVAARETISRRAAALRDAGRKTDIETERAALETARARQQLLDAQSDGDLDEMALRRLIGWSSRAPIVLADDPATALAPPAPGDDVAAARAADPELSSIVEQQTLLAKSAQIAARPFAPIVEAEAQYQRLTRANHYDQYYLRFKADDWSVGLTLALPLWTGGQKAAREARARSLAAKLGDERRSRETGLDLETRRAVAANDHAAAALSLARRARGISEEELKLARLRASEGRGEADAVAQAEIGQADADQAVARAEFDLAAARARLLALRGELVTAQAARAGAPPEQDASLAEAR